MNRLTGGKTVRRCVIRGAGPVAAVPAAACSSPAASASGAQPAHAQTAAFRPAAGQPPAGLQQAADQMVADGAPRPRGGRSRAARRGGRPVDAGWRTRQDVKDIGEGLAAIVEDPDGNVLGFFQAHRG